MRTLMLPGDERRFASFMTRDLGFVLLRTDVAVGGKPDLVGDPLVLPAELPGPSASRRDVLSLMFWCRAAGPVRTLGDAPRPTTIIENRWREVQRERRGEEYEHAVDVAHSPVIQLRRSIWTQSDRLRPGGVEAMLLGMSVKDMPVAVQRALQQACEWVMREAKRIAPPPDIARHLPTKRDRQAAVVWALPQAAKWVADGGCVDVG